MNSRDTSIAHDNVRPIIKPKMPAPIGHELPLSAMVKKREKIRLILLSGDIIIGDILNFDKYSITLNVDSVNDEPDTSSDNPRIYFKHAVESFERDGVRV